MALPWFMLNHSNLRYPAWFERWASLLMATADAGGGAADQRTHDVHRAV